MTNPATTLPATPAAHVITADQYIAPALWGRDHWSTLAYLDTVMTDCAGFEMGSDARMRANRRNARVMAAVPRPKRVRSAHASPLPGTLAIEGSRLKDGQTVAGHDDWNCIEDMAQAGLFNIGPLGLAPGKVLKLSPLGRAVVARLRQHKQDGGQFAQFDIALVPEATAEALVPPPEEYFTWAGLSFDIGTLVANIEAGKLRPQADTLDRVFIENYGKQLLALDAANPGKQVFGLFIAVDGPRAHAMPESVLDKPVLIGFVGKNKGVLNLDGTGAHYVLIDGNHRMAKAFFAGTEKLPVLVINQAQLRKYKE
jgi:hypothetical protein